MQMMIVNSGEQRAAVGFDDGLADRGPNARLDSRDPRALDAHVDALSTELCALDQHARVQRSASTSVGEARAGARALPVRARGGAIA